MLGRMRGIVLGRMLGIMLGIVLSPGTAPALEFDAHLEGEEEVGGTWGDAHGFDAEILHELPGLRFIGGSSRYGVDGGVAGEGKVVVQHNAPRAVEGEFGIVLEGEMPLLIGRRTAAGDRGAKPAFEVLPDQIGSRGGILEPRAQGTAIEPIKQESGQRKPEKKQGLAHQPNEVRLALEYV